MAKHCVRNARTHERSGALNTNDLDLTGAQYARAACVSACVSRIHTRLCTESETSPPYGWGYSGKVAMVVMCVCSLFVAVHTECACTEHVVRTMREHAVYVAPNTRRTRTSAFSVAPSAWKRKHKLKAAAPQIPLQLHGRCRFACYTP